MQSKKSTLWVFGPRALASAIIVGAFYALGWNVFGGAPIYRWVAGIACWCLLTWLLHRSRGQYRPTYSGCPCDEPLDPDEPEGPKCRNACIIDEGETCDRLAAYRWQTEASPLQATTSGLPTHFAEPNDRYGDPLERMKMM